MLNNEAKVNAPMKTTRDNDNLADAQCLDREGITAVATFAVVNHQEIIRRYYEQTRGWSKVEQARRVLDYSTQWKIWAMALCLTASAGHAATSPSATLAAGDTIRGRADADGRAAVSTTQVTAYSGAPVAFRVGLPGSPTVRCGPASEYETTTTDGYVGIAIAPDVVMGLDGSAQGGFLIGTGIEATAVGTWGAKGHYSATSPSGYGSGSWCGAVIQNTEQIKWNASQYPRFSGSYFIHAGPAAVPGVYSTPYITLSRAANMPVYIDMVLPGTVTVLGNDCTVSMQNPVVDFGTVQQKSGIDALLGFFPSGLNINCSGTNTNTAAMEVSFTGTQGRWTDTLAVQGTEGQGTLAEIRGVRATGNGSCANEADRMQFQGQQYSIGNVGLGQTSIPLTWSLCSNGKGGLGAGTAQATVTLIWP